MHCEYSRRKTWLDQRSLSNERHLPFKNAKCIAHILTKKKTTECILNEHHNQVSHSQNSVHNICCCCRRRRHHHCSIAITFDHDISKMKSCELLIDMVKIRFYFRARGFCCKFLIISGNTVHTSHCDILHLHSAVASIRRFQVLKIERKRDRVLCVCTCRIQH